MPDPNVSEPLDVPENWEALAGAGLVIATNLHLTQTIEWAWGTAAPTVDKMHPITPRRTGANATVALTVPDGVTMYWRGDAPRLSGAFQASVTAATPL